MSKKKKQELDEHVIARKALELIDEDGIDSFSTRKLGKALGVEAMAIYWYYPSKDALLDAVVDELVSRIEKNVPVPKRTKNKNWARAMRDVAHAYRGLAHRHPKAFPLVATRRFATKGTYAFLERLFGLAHAQGIDDRTVARFFRAISAYCNGIALNELAARDTSKTSANFARVTAVSKWLAPSHHDDLFEFGLDVLIAKLSHS